MNSRAPSAAGWRWRAGIVPPVGLIAWAAWLGGWILSVVGAGAAPLTIATYNVENYTLADRMTDAGYRKGYPKPETQKAAVRAVIRGLAADVLVLQEMGPRPFLDELQRDLKAEGVDYPFVALANAADADRHLAVLSRRPLRRVVTHRDLHFTYLGQREEVKRGMVEVTVDLGAGELTLFGVHLKSRFTERAEDPFSAIRRASEATVVRDRILERFPQPGRARFLVLGDCNDPRNSRTLALLQKRGKTEVAELLNAADSRGETWTHAFRKEDSYSRVDHIFVSGALKPAVRGGAATIYDGPGVKAASDHRPVFIVIDESE